MYSSLLYSCLHESLTIDHHTSSMNKHSVTLIFLLNIFEKAKNILSLGWESHSYVASHNVRKGEDKQQWGSQLVRAEYCILVDLPQSKAGP